MVALLLLAAQARAQAPAPLLLELVLNGQATGKVGQFVEGPNGLAATAAELTALGLAVPDSLAATTTPIPLAALPGLKAELNMAEQRLRVTAADTALRPTDLTAPEAEESTPVSPAGTGLVLNHDTLLTRTSQATSLGSALDARVFGPWGVLQSTALASLAPAANTVQRLDTTYLYTDPDNLRRWRLGDLTAGMLTWSRAVRLAGAQLASDFSLQPGFVSFPQPLVSASAAVPSTVDVLVNGIRQYSQPVTSGPFQVRNLPVVNGAGELSVNVQDALGRQTTVTLPFYAAAELLRPGLSSYSLEAGVVRQSYGLPDDGYAGGAALASLRTGLLDWVTGEAHGELATTLQQGGLGLAIRVGTLGVLSLAAAASHSSADSPTAATKPLTGTTYSAAISRKSAGFALGLSAQIASAGFRDVAALGNAPYPRLVLNASAARGFGPYGSLALGYVRQQGGRPSVSTANLTATSLAGGNVSLLTATWSLPISERFALISTGFKDLAGTNLGISVSLTFLLGGRDSGSAGIASDHGRGSTTLQYDRTALEAGELGFTVTDQEGIGATREAQAEYASPWGRAVAGISNGGNGTAVQAGLRGGIVWADSALLFADPVNDAFAIARTGDVPGVPVLFENRHVGDTNAAGRLLVPALNAYQPNTIAIDPDHLPEDAQMDRVSQLVRPPSRAGVIVDFGVRRSRAALLRLTLPGGAPVPVGASARLPGGDPAPVGHDGEAYLTGLSDSNDVEVTLPSGALCHASFRLPPSGGAIPKIGPLPCRAP